MIHPAHHDQAGEDPSKFNVGHVPGLADVCVCARVCACVCACAPDLESSDLLMCVCARVCACVCACAPDLESSDLLGLDEGTLGASMGVQEAWWEAARCWACGLLGFLMCLAFAGEHAWVCECVVCMCAINTVLAQASRLSFRSV